MKRLPIDSSSIASVGYDFRAQVLEIEYRGGGTYDYLGVPPDLYHALLNAQSKGRFVNYRIKDRYSYRLVSH